MRVSQYPIVPWIILQHHNINILDITWVVQDDPTILTTNIIAALYNEEGEGRQTKTCLTCGLSNRIQGSDFATMYLGLANLIADTSLHDLLKTYLGDVGEPANCENCQSNQNITLTRNIAKYPEVMQFTFKR